MLKSGYLANNVVMVSICHTDKIIKKYEKVLDKIFKEISDLNMNKITKSKKFKNAFQGFYRLN